MPPKTVAKATPQSQQKGTKRRVSFANLSDPISNSGNNETVVYKPRAAAPLGKRVRKLPYPDEPNEDEWDEPTDDESATADQYGDIEMVDDNDVVNCVCGKNPGNALMVCCDKCECWFHAKCMGIARKEAEKVSFWCPRCSGKKNPSIFYDNPANTEQPGAAGTPTASGDKKQKPAASTAKPAPQKKTPTTREESAEFQPSSSPSPEPEPSPVPQRRQSVKPKHRQPNNASDFTTSAAPVNNIVDGINAPTLTPPAQPVSNGLIRQIDANIINRNVYNESVVARLQKIISTAAADSKVALVEKTKKQAEIIHGLEAELAYERDRNGDLQGLLVAHVGEEGIEGLLAGINKGEEAEARAEADGGAEMDSVVEKEANAAVEEAVVDCRGE
jgi:hypothetical protein